ncbi:type II secretion system F family protein [Pendulispora albinea]|uniref:Type II secretion system F family protein n=1 Tax=Pendulispora albinea TaxID=2741071 RepID=A0ABZ2LR03_9BACT
MTYPFYRIAMVALLVLSVGPTVFWIASRPSRPTSRLGMRGLKRQQSLLRKPIWASIEPFVRWMGVRVGALLDSATRTKLDLLLTYAGDYLGMSADEYFACIVTGGIVGGAFGTLAAYLLHMSIAWLPIPVGIALGAGVPYLIVDGARVNRWKAINRGLPYAVDLMALSMSAGLDFPGSVQQVVEKAKANEAMREELAYMLQQLQLGRTRTQALRELAARVPIESVREFAQALIQAEERGNPVAAVLEVQAATARTRRSNLAEKAAENMRAKMVLPTMILIGVGMMLIAVPSSMMLDKISSGMMSGSSK